jgi:hypothetical protein
VKSRTRKMPRHAARRTGSAHRAGLEELVLVPDAILQVAPQPTLRERLVEAVDVQEDRRRSASGEPPWTSAGRSLQAANEELARAKNVLAFYATEANYLFLGAESDVARVPPIFRDEGRRARAVLGKESGLDERIPQRTQIQGEASS